MPLFVIGVDGGGSKTAAVVLNEFGKVLGRGRSGSSNYHHLGVAIGDHLQEAMHAAAQEAGLDWRRAAAVSWMLAGVDRPVDRQHMGELATALLPGIPVYIDNDAVAALTAGLSEVRENKRPVVSHTGIVLIAGTGMNTYGENAQGDRARSGGWGYVLEEGSGYELALQTLRAIIRSAEGLAPPTSLTEHILTTLDLTSPSDIITWMYEPQRRVSEVAKITPLLLAEAEAGDLVSIQVAKDGADTLAGHVLAVARKLDWEDKAFRLVYSGGMLTNNDYFRRLVTQAVTTQLPLVQPVLPQLDAAEGAGLLALEGLGLSDSQAEQEAERIEGLWASERANVLTRDLDLLPTETLVGIMHLQDKQATGSLWPELPAIAEAIDAIVPRMRQGGRLIYVGAGTSGRLGVLDASECPPTFNASPEQVVGVIAGGEEALTRSVELAEDDPQAGSIAMQTIEVGSLDSVVGISASGRAPFVLGALEKAADKGALTIALTNNLPAPLAEQADLTIAPLVGPEILTGSTRLKAGTAQKLVLNMLSTGVMIRLGKTYGNLMVDVQQANKKLQQRARRIVAQACDIGEEEAAEVLAGAGGDVKTAVVSVLANCTPDEAKARLEAAQGNLRAATTSNQ